MMYGMVWYGMVWYGAVWYGAGMVCYGHGMLHLILLFQFFNENQQRQSLLRTFTMDFDTKDELDDASALSLLRICVERLHTATQI